MGTDRRLDDNGLDDEEVLRRHRTMAVALLLLGLAAVLVVALM